MAYKLPRNTPRAINKATWLGLVGIGVIAGACGGDGDNNGQGGSTSSSSGSTVSSSAGSGGGAEQGASSSSAAGTGGAEQSSSSSASSSGGAGPDSSSSASGAGGAGSGGGGGGGGSSGHLAEWVKTFLGSEQKASSVAADAQGNIYVGGTFANGQVEFGSGQLDCPFEPGAYRWCGYLVKLDPTGKTLWSRAFVSAHTLSIDVTALGVGADGVVIAARWQRYQLLHSPLDIGTGPLDPPGDNPMLLARFDPSGTPVWAGAFGSDAGEVVPASVVVDGPGSFTIGGGFSTASLDLGAGPMPFIGPRTLFLAHFGGTTSPAVEWQKSFGNKKAQNLGGFGRGPGGELLLAGVFEQTLSFGGPILTSGGSASIFRATLDATGGFVSSQSFDNNGTYVDASGVAVDAAGSTLVTGMFDGTQKFDATSLVCQGDVNGYLAKIDAQGKVVFALASTEPGALLSDGYYYVAADASNNVVWGSDLLFSTPSEDYLQGNITKLDPAGATLWSVAGKNFGPRAFAFDGGGNVIAAGEFSNQIDIAKSGPIIGTTAANAFIAKFAP